MNSNVSYESIQQFYIYNDNGGSWVKNGYASNSILVLLFVSREIWHLRRRIYTEEKAKVVAASWGTELIQFLAALSILNKEIILVQNSWRCPPSSSNGLWLLYCINPSSMGGIYYKITNKVLIIPMYKNCLNFKLNTRKCFGQATSVFGEIITRRLNIS